MIETFDEKKVLDNQCWLTPQDNLHAIMVADGMPPSPLQHYILTSDFRIVEEPNVIRWGFFLEKAQHRVIQRTVVKEGRSARMPNLRGYGKRHRDMPVSKNQEVFVSTVFIGIDQNCLFESMIFGSWLDQMCWRDSTKLEAERTHSRLIEEARRCIGYVKRHPSVRKDYLRLDRFWDLARKRGENWALKHVDVMARVESRLLRIPGQPSLPMGDPLIDLALSHLPRTIGD